MLFTFIVSPSKDSLFVSAGIARDKPLDKQNEELWWGGGFADLDEPYNNILRLIRGYDPKGGGIASGKYGITLDGGDEEIFAALIRKDGQLLETIQAN